MLSVPALKGAALIGQRMNRETYQEVRGYLDAFFGPEAVQPIDVPALTHFGQPYDGATRYFRPMLFVAAVRAALGEASLLHSVDAMPPKNGCDRGDYLKSTRCEHTTIANADGFTDYRHIGQIWIYQSARVLSRRL